MPFPYPNPSYSSTVNRNRVQSATPKLHDRVLKFNTLSCNKYAISERKYQPDLRPLADPKFHKECTDLVFNFCVKNQYPIRKEAFNFLSITELEKLFNVSRRTN